MLSTTFARRKKKQNMDLKKKLFQLQNICNEINTQINHLLEEQEDFSSSSSFKIRFICLYELFGSGQALLHERILNDLQWESMNLKNRH